MKQKRLVALLLVLAMLFAVVTVIAACDKDDCATNGHKLTAVGKKDATLEEAGYEAYWKCSVCGKMFSDSEGKNEISKPVEIPQLTPHVCGHVCETCGKCLDETCTDPVCADKCQGHVADGEFTPITQPVAGQYYMGMKCSGDTYYYLKGGMNGYYMATSSNKEEAVIVDLIADGDGWLLKQGNQYMEIENSNGHINAVYKATRTAGKNWSWDETYNIFTWENGTYFYGTYGSFNTIGGGNYATHAASNYKAQLGTFGNQQVVQPDPESVTLNKSGTLYLAPQSGNYIQLNATVQPAAASQDVEWSSSNEQAATVQNGKVTYVGAGQTTITATAKGTDKKIEITVIVTEKGSKEQPLSVDEAIALMDTAGDGVTLGDANNKFYITGKVEEGSVLAESNWMVNLLGTGGKKLQAVIDHNKYYYSLGSPSPQNGGLDNFTLVLSVSMTKSGSSYPLSDIISYSGTRPALTGIQIDESVTLDMGGSAVLTATPIPANALLGDNIEWHTSAEQTATVANGVVVGVAAGTAEITASVGEITSNKCTVTVNAVEVTKAVYDWTEAYTGKAISTDPFDSVSADIVNDYINVWTPGQLEIKTLTISGFGVANKNMMKNNPGIDYDGYFATAPGNMVITTEHAIKKITLKIVATQYANAIQLTVNGTEFKQEKGSNTWNGQLGSASEYNPEFDLSAAPTNTIIITAPQSEDLSYVIVGITLEW